jgi:Asp-tRNA(Asn)/Glu-tRNA(Gln) amidotransferase A subunit family amidase
MKNSKNQRKKTNQPVLLGFLIALLFASISLNLFLMHRKKGINLRTISAAEQVIGLQFNDKERKLMVEGLREREKHYDSLREISIENDTVPALYFNPIIPGIEYPQYKSNHTLSIQLDADIKAPSNIEEVAYYPVTSLAYLIKSRQITSTELTKMYIKRLKKYNPLLKCVVTLMEESALNQAHQADKEIANGRYRGPLHGIPWGAKDLLATKGVKTTWGARPYKEQIIDKDSTVVSRLHEGGAVLVAKLTLGALAMGDVWYHGKTRNPWNTKQGSSGSSAGPAAATAAGLVGFSIGSETYGSIVSPSTRCGVTGLRPTFGRISRFNAMALSWSMDKLGPMCRSVEDCAIVFSLIYGPDGKDLTVVDKPFNWDPALDIQSLRIGFLKKEFEKEYKTKKNDLAVLEVMKKLGIKLLPKELPDFPVRSISFILSAEAATAFDELTRTNKDDLLVRQDKHAWPNTFRKARFIPAVEYIQANRARTVLMKAMAEKMKDIDVLIAPSFQGNTLLLTNLTGHPAVVVPNGFNEKGTPTSITFVGRLYDEAKILAVASVYQKATTFHLQHPNLKERVDSGSQKKE